MKELHKDATFADYDAMKRDRDELVELMRAWCTEAGLPHHPACPQDDTCDCVLVKKLSDVINRGGEK